MNLVLSPKVKGTFKKFKAVSLSYVYSDARIERLEYQNKVILPLTSSTNLRWIIFRIFGYDLYKKCSLGNFGIISASFKNIKDQLDGLLLMPSFLQGLCEEDYELVRDFIELNNINVFSDYYPENSSYDFTAVIEGMGLRATYFGPSIDFTGENENRFGREKAVLKHFGLGGYSNDVIISTHYRRLELSNLAYQTQISSEMRRYNALEACKTRGVMIGHVFNKDESKYLLEDVEVLLELHQNGCALFSDSLSMDDLIHYDLSSPYFVVLVFTNFWELIRYKTLMSTELQN